MEALDLIIVALREECGVEVDAGALDRHLLNDLDIDSLDLLNATFRIEKDCGVKLPVQAWIAKEYGDEAVVQSPFVLQHLRAFLDDAIRSRASEQASA